jgi:hypothetical protein
MCLSCQAKSSTKTLKGQSTRRSCACNVEVYLIIANKGAADESLSCQTCPKGAQCANGECSLRNTNLTCSDGISKVIGEWAIDKVTGQYVLASCIPGYEMRTTVEQGSADLQQCRKCLENQYIINPDVNACEKCPKGLICGGDAVVRPIVPMSTWAAEEGMYKLKTCPTGYSKISESSAPENQMCDPCLKGQECTNLSCEICKDCQPGHYKSTVGTDPCVQCPPNTYREAPGATELRNCDPCPAGSDTDSKTGQVSQKSCSCSTRLYSNQPSNQPFACSPCPAGAVCSDGTCALQNNDLKCANGLTPIKGIWKRMPTGLFTLLGCPVGHKLNNRTGQDFQACNQCSEGQDMHGRLQRQLDKLPSMPEVSLVSKSRASNL